jgi:outer membrane protein OmpA-like peptidoglycan-associated protein
MKAKPKTPDSFWPSYTDLMTSLFFVMLVLFVLVFSKQHNQIKDLERKLAIIDAVEENLRPLKSDQALFTYEEQYKRFKLSFDVKFVKDKFRITPNELENFHETVSKIDQAGIQLKSIIDNLKISKDADQKLKNVSYILVIAGYASRTGQENHNYELSYQRALSLWNYWRAKGIDFEGSAYNNLIDLQISGNGWGGIGRSVTEMDNQRFLIQIFPKIGDIK